MNDIQIVLMTSTLCTNLMLLYLIVQSRYRTSTTAIDVPKCLEAYPTYIRYPYPPNRDIVIPVSDV